MMIKGKKMRRDLHTRFIYKYHSSRGIQRHMVAKFNKLTGPLLLSPNTFAPILQKSFMAVMHSAKDTELKAGTQGQAANLAQIQRTAGSSHQASAVDSSTVSWHQINRPWEDQHKSADNGAVFGTSEDMDPCKIPIRPLSLVLEVIGDASLAECTLAVLFGPKHLAHSYSGLYRSYLCSRLRNANHSYQLDDGWHRLSPVSPGTASLKYVMYQEA